jgi:hypothetical protein
MGRQHEGQVVLALRQLEELLAQLSCGVQLRLGAMKSKETPQRMEELRRLPNLLA